MEALCKIAGNWGENIPYRMTPKKKKKVWYSHTMKYYIPVNRSKVGLHTLTLMYITSRI